LLQTCNRSATGAISRKFAANAAYQSWERRGSARRATSLPGLPLPRRAGAALGRPITAIRRASRNRSAQEVVQEWIDVPKQNSRVCSIMEH
jgi:hypothetical protein